MLEVDKEAFEKWYLEYPSWVVTMSRQESCSKAWQAACEYKQKESYGLNQSLETSVYHDKKQLKIIQKLEAENAKLRECVEKVAYSYDRPTDMMNNARQVLKELEEK